MTYTEGIASGGKPRNRMADAGASRAGSGSVAESLTAGAGSPGSEEDGPGAGVANPCKGSVFYYGTSLATSLIGRASQPCLAKASNETENTGMKHVI